ncbi:MAG: hypothetical protein N3D73_00145 [Candidatus Diapherotrites archaeon]|nr:hypothetical protein [Candidatus Diapherotrites archaeon]
MEINFFKINPKKILFIPIFALIFLIASRINFSPLLGVQNQYFTLNQLLGPIAGAFLGPLVGAISVLLAQIVDFFIAQKTFDWVNIFRLTPMLFAAYYFGKKDSKFIALVPIFCMLLFIVHPIGNQVWYYSLYWLIPIVAATIFSENRIAKSFGATFTAHAIGSTIFLYTIPSTPILWQTLIPIVAFERTVFALGIWFSYLGMNTLLNKFEHYLPQEALHIDKKYVISKSNLKILAG